MEQELIKPVIKVGNSAGVLVPKSWINGNAKVELIQKPLNIKKDILEILEPSLKDTIGIYIVGSYARGEQAERSDVDILVITSKTNSVIVNGKYNIILISEDKLRDALKNNALPILPMLKEAKTLLNNELVEKYKNTGLNKRNLRFYIESGKSILKVNRASIDIDKQVSLNCGDVLAYSLTLRLRSAYIIDCIKNRQKWSNGGLFSLIKKTSGSLKAYEGYLRVKDNRPEKEELPILEAEKLYSYILKKIREHEEWAKRKK